MEPCNSNTSSGESGQISSAPVSDRSIRSAMSGHPSWMQDQAIAWAREQEAAGNEFTGGQAVANHFLH